MITKFYNGIHSLYMKYFKQDPRTIKDISNQSLWLNKYITINNKPIFSELWEIVHIHKLRDIVNDSNTPLIHNQIVSKYNLKTTFLETLQSSIPKNGFDTIKNTQNVSNTEDENTITVNSTVKKISKTSCKDFYWHIINYSPHIPKSNSHWHNFFSISSNRQQFLEINIPNIIQYHKKNRNTSHPIQNHT